MYNSGEGTVTISGGRIVGGDSTGNSCGLENCATGTVEITGGTIVGGETTNFNSSGVRNTGGGSVTISGGRIVGGVSSNNNSYGLYNETSKGTVTFSGSPVIEGGTAEAGLSTSIRLGSLSPSLTLDKDFVPAAGTAYTVLRGNVSTPEAGIFAKPGEGAALKAEWFSPASNYTNHTVQLTTDGNLEIVENTN